MTVKSENTTPLLEPIRSVFVDDVWSGSSPAFHLETRGNKQYVAYYNADRQMTVASGEGGKWSYHKLDDFIG